MTGFLTNLFAFGASLIPLLVAFFTLLRNRADKTNAPLDTPALKIIKIIRHPVDDKVWNKTKKIYRIWASLNTIFSCILAFSIILMLEYFFGDIYFLNLYPSQLYFIIIIASGGLVFILTANHIFRYQNALQARYILFKDIEILIESDYSYLFNKCLEGLRNLGTQIVEINSDAHLLEASKYSFWRTPGNINIEIKAVKDRDNCFSLQIEITGLQVEMRSKIINRFINQVINKPKNSRNEA
jgi:hypothetical protein